MNPRVLVVDDSDESLFLLSSKMEAEGYEVAGATNGMEALEKVKSFHPDIVLLDVMMPQLDGYEVCRRLKSDEDTRYIPVIMITGKGELEDKVMGLGLGAEDYITKPYSMVELSARVRSLLGMRMLQSRLRESEKMAALGEMVDGIAHEVRNPLVTIGGMARRLREHETDEERKRCAETIIKSVDRMERMLQRIDEYKWILVSRLSPCNVNEVVEKAVEAAEELAEGKRIKITVSLMADPPELRLDGTNMKMAFFNVLQNSVEAIEDTGTIEVLTSAGDGGSVVVTVTDTGCGIEEQEIRKVFNPFHTSKMTGAGLGLTISYRIITDHGGEIKVTSRKGEGSVFTITLPPSATPPALS
ncbi:MAG: response regulator [Thermodesulfobacteriota bacterium]